MESLEKTLYHDGIAFMRYQLFYPSGEEFFFAEAMTRGYAAYLEENYFKKLCAVYDADPERRKRYRHSLVKVTQQCRLYRENTLLSLCFHVLENGSDYTFGFTWDSSLGRLMTARDFGVKKRKNGRMKSVFFDGKHLYIFSKKGEVCEKIKTNRAFTR